MNVRTIIESGQLQMKFAMLQTTLTRFALLTLLPVSTLLFVTLFGEIAESDSVPGAISGPFVYNSTDMNEVEVNFADIVYVDESTNKIGRVDKRTGTFIEGEPIDSVRLSRAYINTFSPYSSKASRGKEFRHEYLPDQIFGNDLTIRYVHPSGIPYTVAFPRWKNLTPGVTDSSFGRDYDIQPKAKQIRLLQMTARIIALSPATHTEGKGTTREMKCIGPESCSGVRKRGKLLDIFDGFDHYDNLPTTNQSYYDNGSDEIRKIDCYGLVDQARPNWFCTYTFPLNDALFVELKFLDFRFHGGRKFARDRIRTFKKLFCPVFHCDEKTISAAKVDG
jgi:hypothetical protein